MKNEVEDSRKLAAHVSAASIAGNIILSIIKFAAGLIGHSTALISDAIHSLSDVFSTIVVIIGLSISAKEPDENHEFGHDRFECIFAILLATILFATGAGIGLAGIRSIANQSYKTNAIPGLITLYAAALSIVVKEAMYRFTASAARKINSSALMADAWHHRSDALSSIGALLGVAGTRCGFLICEPIANLIICGMIIFASYEIFMDATNKLTDTSCCDKVECDIRNYVLSIPGVLGLDKLRTRQFGARIYIEIEISADGNLSLYKAHDIAEAVHRGVEDHFPQTKHCVVHVNPK